MVDWLILFIVESNLMYHKGFAFFFIDSYELDEK